MTVKFFLDENMPNSSVDMLKDLGYEVGHARTSGLKGATDDEISKYAKDQKAILVSRDLDFGNVLWYPEGSHHGLLLLRLPHDFTAEQITQKLEKFLKEIEVEKLAGHITILELGRYRVREI
ncbi:MAG: DUF5615 family PIN-like protein [Candidatus Thermoplasmatota archaeon]|nr:DUF5615 family PIN-like protein [Candidatus Thermoplasmatota archaeon]